MILIRGNAARWIEHTLLHEKVFGLATKGQEPDPLFGDGLAEMGWHLLVFSASSPDQTQPPVLGLTGLR
jgi:hypothetical protein